MQNPHTYLDLLVRLREGVEKTMPGHEITKAAAEVLDELIGRVRMVTDELPVQAPETRWEVEAAGAAFDTLAPVMKVDNQLQRLLSEGTRVVGERRAPFIRFMERVVSEGYLIAKDFDAVTDAAESPESTDPAAQAEQGARAEQARAYQQRVERMAGAYRALDAEYGERIRDLITSLPVTPA